MLPPRAVGYRAVVLPKLHFLISNTIELCLWPIRELRKKECRVSVFSLAPLFRKREFWISAL